MRVKGPKGKPRKGKWKGAKETVTCRHKPQVAGKHIIKIKWENEHIKGSPFKIQVRNRPAIETPADKIQVPAIKFESPTVEIKAAVEIKAPTFESETPNIEPEDPDLEFETPPSSEIGTPAVEEGSGSFFGFIRRVVTRWLYF